jgi:hypothetical protein
MVVGLAIAVQVAVTVAPDAIVAGLTLSVAASSREAKKINAITALRK